MPRTRSLAWSELKIGIVAVTAMALAVVFIFAVGGAGGFFWQQYHLKTRFADVQGLKSGRRGPRRRRRGGQGRRDRASSARKSRSRSAVQEGDAVADHHRVARVDRLAEPAGRAGHRHQPVASSGTPLKDGDTAAVGRAPGQLSDVAESATQSLGQINGMLKDIRAGKGTVGKLFTDDDLYREINQFVDLGAGRRGESQRRQGHAGPADQGSGGLQPAERRARQPAAR